MNGQEVARGTMNSRGLCLVIEDDPDIGGLIEVIISGMGFRVRLEETGTTGLLALSPQTALITLDLGLPDMNGLDVAHQMRKVSTAPILMLTAHAYPEVEFDGLAAGADAFLAKPFRPSELRAAVARLCPQDPTPRDRKETMPAMHTNDEASLPDASKE